MCVCVCMYIICICIYVVSRDRVADGGAGRGKWLRVFLHVTVHGLALHFEHFALQRGEDVLVRGCHRANHGYTVEGTMRRANRCSVSNRWQLRLCTRLNFWHWLLLVVGSKQCRCSAANLIVGETFNIFLQHLGIFFYRCVFSKDEFIILHLWGREIPTPILEMLINATSREYTKLFSIRAQTAVAYFIIPRGCKKLRAYPAARWCVLTTQMSEINLY